MLLHQAWTLPVFQSLSLVNFVKISDNKYSGIHFIQVFTYHQSALETQGTLSQCTRMQATAAAASGCVMETIYIPHVEHEAMLFTVWLNPQIVLILAL